MILWIFAGEIRAQRKKWDQVEILEGYANLLLDHLEMYGVKDHHDLLVLEHDQGKLEEMVRRPGSAFGQVIPESARLNRVFGRGRGRGRGRYGASQRTIGHVLGGSSMNNSKYYSGVYFMAVHVFETILCAHTKKAEGKPTWDRSAACNRYVRLMLRSRQSPLVLFRWLKQESGFEKSKQVAYTKKEACIKTLLEITKSSIYLKPVWSFLVDFRQDMLEPFIDAEEPWWGPFLPIQKKAEDSEDGIFSEFKRGLPVNINKKLTTLSVSEEQSLQRAFAKAKEAWESSIGDKDWEMLDVKEGHTEGSAALNRFDHEQLFCLEACYGMHRIPPALCLKLGRQRLQQALNPDRGMPDRVRSLIRWTLLPTTDYTDMVEFMESHPELSVNLVEALLKGVMYNDEFGGPFHYLLQPKFLSSDRARIAAYALPRAIPWVGPDKFTQLLKALLSGKRRHALKVTFYKQIIRLLASMPSQRHVRMILFEWRRDQLHRDVRIAILHVAFQFLEMPSKIKHAQEAAWEILESAAKEEKYIDQIEMLTGLAGVRPKSHSREAQVLPENICLKPRLDQYYLIFDEKFKVLDGDRERFARGVVLPLCQRIFTVAVWEKAQKKLKEQEEAARKAQLEGTEETKKISMEVEAKEESESMDMEGSDQEDLSDDDVAYLAISNLTRWWKFGIGEDAKQILSRIVCYSANSFVANPNDDVRAVLEHRWSIAVNTLQRFCHEHCAVICHTDEPFTEMISALEQSCNSFNVALNSFSSKEQSLRKSLASRICILLSKIPYFGWPNGEVNFGNAMGSKEPSLSVRLNGYSGMEFPSSYCNFHISADAESRIVTVLQNCGKKFQHIILERKMRSLVITENEDANLAIQAVHSMLEFTASHGSYWAKCLNEIMLLLRGSWPLQKAVATDLFDNWNSNIERFGDETAMNLRNLQWLVVSRFPKYALQYPGKICSFLDQYIDAGVSMIVSSSSDVDVDIDATSPVKSVSDRIYLTLMDLQRAHLKLLDIDNSSAWCQYFCEDIPSPKKLSTNYKSLGFLDKILRHVIKRAIEGSGPFFTTKGAFAPGAWLMLAKDQLHQNTPAIMALCDDLVPTLFHALLQVQIRDLPEQLAYGFDEDAQLLDLFNKILTPVSSLLKKLLDCNQISAKTKRCVLSAILNNAFHSSGKERHGYFYAILDASEIHLGQLAESISDHWVDLVKFVVEYALESPFTKIPITRNQWVEPQLQRFLKKGEKAMRNSSGKLNQSFDNHDDVFLGPPKLSDANWGSLGSMDSKESTEDYFTQGTQYLTSCKAYLYKWLLDKLCDPSNPYSSRIFFLLFAKRQYSMLGCTARDCSNEVVCHAINKISSFIYHDIEKQDEENLTPAIMNIVQEISEQDRGQDSNIKAAMIDSVIGVVDNLAALENSIPEKRPLAKAYSLLWTLLRLHSGILISECPDRVAALYEKLALMNPTAEKMENHVRASKSLTSLIKHYFRFQVPSPSGIAQSSVQNISLDIAASMFADILKKAKLVSEDQEEQTKEARDGLKFLFCDGNSENIGMQLLIEHFPEEIEDVLDMFLSDEDMISSCHKALNSAFSVLEVHFRQNHDALGLEMDESYKRMMAAIVGKMFQLNQEQEQHFEILSLRQKVKMLDDIVGRNLIKNPIMFLCCLRDKICNIVGYFLQMESIQKGHFGPSIVSNIIVQLVISFEQNYPAREPSAKRTKVADTKTEKLKSRASLALITALLYGQLTSADPLPRDSDESESKMINSRQHLSTAMNEMVCSIGLKLLETVPVYLFIHQVASTDFFEFVFKTRLGDIHHYRSLCSKLVAIFQQLTVQMEQEQRVETIFQWISIFMDMGNQGSKRVAHFGKAFAFTLLTRYGSESSSSELDGLTELKSEWAKNWQEKVRYLSVMNATEDAIVSLKSSTLVEDSYAILEDFFECADIKYQVGTTAAFPFPV